jgi:hypothetical protein
MGDGLATIPHLARRLVATKIRERSPFGVEIAYCPRLVADVS